MAYEYTARVLGTEQHADTADDGTETVDRSMTILVDNLSQRDFVITGLPQEDFEVGDRLHIEVSEA